VAADAEEIGDEAGGFESAGLGHVVSEQMIIVDELQEIV
jgi:hypothetical protein